MEKETEMMEITKLSLKGSNSWNEDALVEHPALAMYGVIDGATSLVPFTGENGATGGYYASRIIADFLHGMPSSSGSDWNPAEAMLQANRILHDEMVKQGIRADRKDELWGACAVLIRIEEDFIEYAQAGDCMLAAVYEDGSIRTVTHDQLAHVDNRTRELWAEGVEAGLRTNTELWAHVKPQIINGRNTANTAEGYAVINGDPALSRYIESGRINRIQLKALLLISDGLYMPKPAGFPAADAEEVTRSILDKGLEGYVNWLIQLEEGDPQCLQYPRVKKSDDKTAIWIDFK
ncbi:protein phosphatase 2C family protein [Paenibacillus alkaliterrae]|uniref:PP2C family serine/threonine-protein phosphatase n=1 Tax=Paenibacillus alkaliterrae TaxID=320909 RepID=UPI001F2A3037|nr:PP2C family serine/threonine-protein phosphatase [Paenibacillus alkaliterrae]MCF2939678.1 protein phosphatase 2C family protein [Paenibacillus alkaliterrae]